MISLLSLLLIVAYQYILRRWKKMDEHKQKEFANRKPPTPPETEISKQYSTLQAEVQKMKKDAEGFNTTETFAKYSKLQRQLIPKEEQLEQLQKQYEQEQELFQKQWEEEQSKIVKPPSDAGKIKQIDRLTKIVLSFIFWFIYIDINGVNIQQFQPILGTLGYRSTENGVQIWGLNWMICCHLIGECVLDKILS